MAGSSVAHAEPEDAALRHKKAWHHAGYCGQYLCLSGSLKLTVVYDRNGIWQQFLRNRIGCAGHYHFIKNFRRINIFGS